MKQVKYADIRDSIKSGDRIEFAGNTVIGRLIRWFTKDAVNHTALALSIDEYSNYLGNRKFILEAESDGIVLNTLSHDIQTADGKVFYTPLLLQFDDRRKQIADWALQQVGTGYDFGSLFKNVLGAVNADMKKLFCSEYYFIALVQAGIIPGCELCGKIVTDHNGGPVKSPRPGEFGRFPVFGETVEIVS